MKVRVIAVLALFTLLVAGCANTPAAKAKSKLRSALGSDAKGIEVRVEGSVATLSGTVTQRSTQELAEEVVRSVPGITSVENRIKGPEARGLEKLREEAKDAALEIEVKAALVSDAGSTTAGALEIEACDGVVSLRGTLADRSTAKHAVEVVERHDGVRSVIDLIDLGK